MEPCDEFNLIVSNRLTPPTRAPPTKPLNKNPVSVLRHSHRLWYVKPTWYLFSEIKLTIYSYHDIEYRDNIMIISWYSEYYSPHCSCACWIAVWILNCRAIIVGLSLSNTECSLLRCRPIWAVPPRIWYSLVQYLHRQSTTLEPNLQYTVSIEPGIWLHTQLVRVTFFDDDELWIDGRGRDSTNWELKMSELRSEIPLDSGSADDILTGGLTVANQGTVGNNLIEKFVQALYGPCKL